MLQCRASRLDRTKPTSVDERRAHATMVRQRPCITRFGTAHDQGDSPRCGLSDGATSRGKRESRRITAASFYLAIAVAPGGPTAGWMRRSKLPLRDLRSLCGCAQSLLAHDPTGAQQRRGPARHGEADGSAPIPGDGTCDAASRQPAVAGCVPPTPQHGRTERANVQATVGSTRAGGRPG